MRTGVDRILVTHTGSLPRPVGVALPGTEAALAGGTASDDDLRQAVADLLAAQVAAGVDVVNDGEMSKPSYSTYVTGRLTGFELGPTAGRPLFEARTSPSSSPGWRAR